MCTTNSDFSRRCRMHVQRILTFIKCFTNKRNKLLWLGAANISEKVQSLRTLPSAGLLLSQSPTATSYEVGPAATENGKASSTTDALALNQIALYCISQFYLILGDIGTLPCYLALLIANRTGEWDLEIWRAPAGVPSPFLKVWTFKRLRTMITFHSFVSRAINWWTFKLWRMDSENPEEKRRRQREAS